MAERSFNRREWLRASLAGGALAAVGGACGGPPGTSGEGADAAPEPEPDAHPLADDTPVAVFEVSPDGAIVWAAAAEASEAMVEISSGADVITRPIQLATGDHHTGSLLLTDLAPDTEYGCRILHASGATSARTRFRTAPGPGADARVHFAVSADIGEELAGSSPILPAITRSGADFYVNLGDWPYADQEPAARMVEEFRIRHAAVRTPTPVRELLRAIPVFAIYDDHDILCNWDEADRAAQPERIAAGLQAWDEFFPLRGPTRYRSWRWGRHAELFLLDTRLYRSANDAVDNADKTILGAEQKSWLREGLRASDATFKILLSSVPFDFSRPVDDWQAFTTEREELFDFMRAEAIRGVVLLSADRHYFAAHHHRYGLREFHVGPAAAGLGGPLPDQPEVVFAVKAANYGDVIIEGGDEPRLRFTCRGGQAEEIYAEMVDPIVVG